MVIVLRGAARMVGWSTSSSRIWGRGRSHVGVRVDVQSRVRVIVQRLLGVSAGGAV
jgi:hypothetical protein